MRKVTLYCEVHCDQCGNVINIQYHNAKTISKLKDYAKDWINHPEYGDMCPKCQEKMLQKSAAKVKHGRKYEL